MMIDPNRRERKFYPFPFIKALENDIFPGLRFCPYVIYASQKEFMYWNDFL